MSQAGTELLVTDSTDTLKYPQDVQIAVAELLIDRPSKPHGRCVASSPLLTRER
jgi:hypothetical protein